MTSGRLGYAFAMIFPENFKMSIFHLSPAPRWAIPWVPWGAPWDPQAPPGIQGDTPGSLGNLSGMAGTPLEPQGLLY